MSGYPILMDNDAIKAQQYAIHMAEYVKGNSTLEQKKDFRTAATNIVRHRVAHAEFFNSYTSFFRLMPGAPGAFSYAAVPSKIVTGSGRKAWSEQFTSFPEMLGLIADAKFPLHYESTPLYDVLAYLGMGRLPSEALPVSFSNPTALWVALRSLATAWFNDDDFTLTPTLPQVALALEELKVAGVDDEWCAQAHGRWQAACEHAAKAVGYPYPAYNPLEHPKWAQATDLGLKPLSKKFLGEQVVIEKPPLIMPPLGEPIKFVPLDEETPKDDKTTDVIFNAALLEWVKGNIDDNTMQQFDVAATWVARLRCAYMGAGSAMKEAGYPLVVGASATYLQIVPSDKQKDAQQRMLWVNTNSGVGPMLEKLKVGDVEDALAYMAWKSVTRILGMGILPDAVEKHQYSQQFPEGTDFIKVENAVRTLVTTGHYTNDGFTVMPSLTRVLHTINALKQAGFDKDWCTAAHQRWVDAKDHAWEAAYGSAEGAQDVKVTTPKDGVKIVSDLPKKPSTKGFETSDFPDFEGYTTAVKFYVLNTTGLPQAKFEAQYLTSGNPPQANMFFGEDFLGEDPVAAEDMFVKCGYEQPHDVHVLYADAHHALGGTDEQAAMWLKALGYGPLLTLLRFLSGGVEYPDAYAMKKALTGVLPTTGDRVALREVLFPITDKNSNLGTLPMMSSRKYAVKALKNLGADAAWCDAALTWLGSMIDKQYGKQTSMPPVEKANSKTGAAPVNVADSHNGIGGVTVAGCKFASSTQMRNFALSHAKLLRMRLGLDSEEFGEALPTGFLTTLTVANAVHPTNAAWGALFGSPKATPSVFTAAGHGTASSTLAQWVKMLEQSSVMWVKWPSLSMLRTLTDVVGMGMKYPGTANQIRYDVQKAHADTPEQKAARKVLAGLFTPVAMPGQSFYTDGLYSRMQKVALALLTLGANPTWCHEAFNRWSEAAQFNGMQPFNKTGLSVALGFGTGMLATGGSIPTVVSASNVKIGKIDASALTYANVDAASAAPKAPTFEFIESGEVYTAAKVEGDDSVLMRLSSASGKVGLELFVNSKGKVDVRVDGGTLSDAASLLVSLVHHRTGEVFKFDEQAVADVQAKAEKPLKVTSKDSPDKEAEKTLAAYHALIGKGAGKSNAAAAESAWDSLLAEDIGSSKKPVKKKAKQKKAEPLGPLADVKITGDPVFSATMLNTMHGKHAFVAPNGKITMLGGEGEW